MKTIIIGLLFSQFAMASGIRWVVSYQEFSLADSQQVPYHDLNVDRKLISFGSGRAETRCYALKVDGRGKASDDGNHLEVSCIVGKQDSEHSGNFKTIFVCPNKESDFWSPLIFRNSKAKYEFRIQLSCGDK